MRSRAEEDSLRKRSGPWIDMAKAAISEAVEDAGAHAATLATPLSTDVYGFVTADRGAPLKAANRRLDSLGRTLITIVRRARIDFYVHSHKLHSPNLRPDIQLQG